MLTPTRSIDCEAHTPFFTFLLTLCLVVIPVSQVPALKRGSNDGARATATTTQTGSTAPVQPSPPLCTSPTPVASLFASASHRLPLFSDSSSSASNPPYMSAHGFSAHEPAIVASPSTGFGGGGVVMTVAAPTLSWAPHQHVVAKNSALGGTVEAFKALFLRLTASLSHAPEAFSYWKAVPGRKRLCRKSRTPWVLVRQSRHQ